MVGVIALLAALLTPALQAAHQQAVQTTCMAAEQQIGLALETARSEHEFYPLWDDNGSPIVFTWLDVLVQRHYLHSVRVGYCRADKRPDPLNEARANSLGRTLAYPPEPSRRGIDYSYGIGVPLSAGGWAWRPEQTIDGAEPQPRRFVDHERSPSRRLLVSDATWSGVFNLTGYAIASNVWNDQTQFDNTIAWRHPEFSASVLYQDGHVSRVKYRLDEPTPVDTFGTFVWYPGEPLALTPDSEHDGNYYPLSPPPNPMGAPRGEVLPAEMVPAYYTANGLWSEIPHK